jgi:hypothetical protein
MINQTFNFVDIVIFSSSCNDFEEIIGNCTLFFPTNIFTSIINFSSPVVLELDATVASSLQHQVL